MQMSATAAQCLVAMQERACKPKIYELELSCKIAAAVSHLQMLGPWHKQLASDRD